MTLPGATQHSGQGHSLQNPTAQVSQSQVVRSCVTLDNLLNTLCVLLSSFIFIYLFLVSLGLRCCARAFSSCGERGLLFVVVCGFLIAVASLVEEHGLYAHGLSNCGSPALEHRLSSCGARA